MSEVEELWTPLDGDPMQHLCLALTRLDLGSMCNC